MIPDLDILERRVAAMREILWVIPALIIQMTDEYLDLLDAVADAPDYRSVLNRIVTRIEREAA